MPESITPSMIDREMGADANAARVETVHANFSRLLESDPTGQSVADRREWFTDVLASAEMLSEVTSDQTERQMLEQSVADFRLQVAALNDVREDDVLAWNTLIANARDMMQTVVHGPETSREAA